MSAYARPARADALCGLLSRLRALIGLMLSRGLPVALAAGRALISRAERRAVLAWLRPLEHAARALIFLETLALPAAPERDEDRERPKSRDFYPSTDYEREDRIVLRVGLGELSGSRAPRTGPRAPEAELVSALPLIRRLAAALEAIEDPAPLVRRLAPRVGCDPGPPPRPADRRRGPSVLVATIFEVEAELLAAAYVDTS
jgi:hypothetical protein